MIHRLYRYSTIFYEYNAKLRKLVNKNEFISFSQDNIQRNIYMTDRNADKQQFHLYRTPKHNSDSFQNGNKRKSKAPFLVMAHFLGVFLPSKKKENEKESVEGNGTEGDEKEREREKEKYNNDTYEYYQELSEYSNMQIFSSNSHHELANEICSNLGIGLGRAYVGKYQDGEIALQIMDEVRGRDIYIIHSTPAGGKDVHSRLMELFLFISTLRRSSAKKVTAVIPYLNYSRQTKQLDDLNNVHSLGGPEVAILLQVCGADAIIAVDLHNSRIEGFSTLMNSQPPLMNINPQSLAVEYFKKKKLHNPVIVSIDNEGGERTKEFWVRMKKHSIDAGFTTVVSSSVSEMNTREGSPNDISGDVTQITNSKEKGNQTTENEISQCSLYKIDETNYDTNKEMNDRSNTETKSQPEKNKNHFDTENFTIVGDIKGCDCILIDDIIDTGEKSQKIASLLKNAGARKIYLYATHAILSDGCVEKINDSYIDEVVTTNTIHIPSNICCEKLHILSVAKLVAEGIKRAHKEYSQTALEDFSDGPINLEEQ